MEEYRLQVPGITCGHCVSSITSFVERVDGVTGVSVDVAAKTVRVTGTASRGAVCAAIDDAGYDVAG